MALGVLKRFYIAECVLMFFLELDIELSSKYSDFIGSLLVVYFSCFVHLILTLEKTINF